MIRVVKPDVAPAKLAEGAASTSDHEQQYAADPANGGSVKNPFTFNSKIYGHKTVKDALKSAQHDKCCYCEGAFSAHAAGDVEHFRPKTYSQQEPGAPRLYPGYFWLAYVWANLYFSCEQCNRVGKRNLFPLADPAQRARRGTDDLSAEVPLILDPGGAEDPRDHIKFRNNVPFGITQLGRHTVRYLKLDRPALNLDRLRHLKKLKLLAKLASLDPALLAVEDLIEQEEAKQELATSVSVKGEYSAMAQDLLQPA